MSAPMLGLAIAMVMAPTGYASAQRLWPMHLYPLTMTAWPANIARTSPSGQTMVHVAQPMQYVVSICGCCDWGPSERRLPFWAASRERASRASCPLRYRRTKKSVRMTAIRRPTRLFIVVFSHKTSQQYPITWAPIFRRGDFSRAQQWMHRKGTSSGCASGDDFRAFWGSQTVAKLPQVALSVGI